MFRKLIEKLSRTGAAEPLQQEEAPVSYQNPELDRYFAAQERAEQEVPSEYSWDALASRAKARARYELADELLGKHVEWYRVHVVNTPGPSATEEDRQRFREYLEDWTAEQADMPAAARDRDAVLSLLRKAEDGLTQKELKATHNLECGISYGIFLNQLVRGDWAVAIGEKAKKRFYISAKPREDDVSFLRTEKARQKAV